MRVYLLCSDLMTSSRLTGDAKAVGATLTICHQEAKLHEALAADLATADRPREYDKEIVLVVDLAHLGLAIDKLMEQLGELFTKAGTGRPTVIAFGPHVHTDRLEAAKEAGCHVLVRGQFLRQAGKLFAGKA